MSRKFIIVDPEDEIQLMLSQYLSMGWHDADIEEGTLAEILEDRSLVADAILIGGIRVGDENVQKILQRSHKGELPPAIVISGEEQDDGQNDVLSMEDLTPVMLNGAIAEAIKRHADGISSDSSTTSRSSSSSDRADNELPVERLEGL